MGAGSGQRRLMLAGGRAVTRPGNVFNLETQSPGPHSIIIRHNKRFRKNILQFSKLFATGAGTGHYLVNQLPTAKNHDL